jgi:crotonobetainyl-CoA:carnitine CoA-transferase CaiB-like acyl-CoA transferase
MPFMPMEGVKIIDLTCYTTGPFGTRILADYGADVIKIEPPTGDPARRIGPFYHDEPDLEKSGLFLFLNTSKRSVTLDVTTEAGKDILRRLVREADVLMENYPPGYLPSLGLGYGDLSRVNPKLVYTSITNFGQNGPYKDWEGVDLTLYAMGGNMWGSGDEDLEPLKTAGRMASFHVGYVAALATSMALLKAEMREQGEHVDVSYFDASLHSIDSRLLKLLGYQYNMKVAMRISPAASLGLGSGIWPCADGMFMTTAGPTMFTGLARMIGREDLLHEPGWDTVAARSRPEAAEEFEAIIIPWMVERTTKEVQKACMDYGVLGAPVNTIADLLADEDFNARGYWQTIDHPIVGPLTYPGFHSRIHFDDGSPVPARRPAPLLGQHTADVVSGLGFSPEDIGRLRGQGVI